MDAAECGVSPRDSLLREGAGPALLWVPVVFTGW